MAVDRNGGSGSPADRRDSPRYDVTLDCRIATSEKIVTGRSANLSRSGIALLVPEPIEVSSIVDLELSLVFESGVSEPIQLQATIVWCTALGGGYQVGAKFARLTREVRSHLELFLKFLSGEVGDQGETG